MELAEENMNCLAEEGRLRLITLWEEKGMTEEEIQAKLAEVWAEN